MSLHGDLSTLDLTSLFQNLEGALKTGLLSVSDGVEETELYFEKGKLALILHPGRASFLAYLEESGAVTAEAIDLAKQHKKRGQPLGRALVETGALTAETLRAIATARLTEEACEVLSAGARKFEFTEVEGPADGFDPEERALGIALAATSLLLESARRSDHWVMIRERIPSDSTHYTVVKKPRESNDAARTRFVADVCALLDGTRTVREVVARFPTRRFDVYQLLADLAEKQSIRPIPAADLNRWILELARNDKKRALALLERGLAENPRHLALLCTKAMLAEKAGELEQASEALKLVVHLQLENGESEAARATLKRLKHIDENDPFPWEKSYELALAEGRKKDAITDARALIDLYRKPGLHKKVCGVLERLIDAQGTSWELVRDLARARADAGERDLAVKGLERFAANLIALESYPLATKAYEEVLAIVPGRPKAKHTLADIQSGALTRRKARWRKIRRRALAAVFVFVFLPWLTCEALARRAFVGATRELVRANRIDNDGDAAARAAFEGLRASYPWTTTALFDVGPMLAELGGEQLAADR